MSAISLLGGQKNMQTPATSSTGPPSRLSKLNELQFLTTGHFINLENSINHLKRCYFTLLLHSLKSLMRRI